MALYRHTQVGTLVLLLLGPTVLLMVLLVSAFGAHLVAMAVGALLLLCVAMFPSLTVEVTHTVVRIRFGVGPIRKSFPVSSIRGAQIVRNPWYYGWGIRWFPRGWLFNVSGLDAVELEMTGGRKFRIGTDEPGELLGAIKKVCGDAS
jgi:hypothetical protein